MTRFPLNRTVTVSKLIGRTESVFDDPRPVWAPPAQLRVLGWYTPSQLVDLGDVEQIARIDWDVTLYAPAGAITTDDRVHIDDHRYAVAGVSNWDAAPPGWLIPDMDELHLKEVPE